MAQYVGRLHRLHDRKREVRVYAYADLKYAVLGGRHALRRVTQSGSAVGGNWGGQQGIDDSNFPQRMYVDYVRVYQRTGKIPDTPR